MFKVYVSLYHYLNKKLIFMTYRIYATIAALLVLFTFVSIEQHEYIKEQFKEYSMQPYNDFIEIKKLSEKEINIHFFVTRKGETTFSGIVINPTFTSFGKELKP